MKNVTVSTMKIWDPFIFFISFIRFHFSPDLHIRTHMTLLFIWLCIFPYEICVFRRWYYADVFSIVRANGNKKKRYEKKESHSFFPFVNRIGINWFSNRFSNRYVKCGTISEFTVIKFRSISVSMVGVSIRLHVYDWKHRHRHKSRVFFELLGTHKHTKKERKTTRPQNERVKIKKHSKIASYIVHNPMINCIRKLRFTFSNWQK